MLPDQVSNPGPLTYESGALTVALRGPTLSPVKIRIGMYVFSQGRNVTSEPVATPHRFCLQTFPVKHIP